MFATALQEDAGRRQSRIRWTLGWFLFLMLACSAHGRQPAIKASATRSRLPVIWLHVHKAAGTWMCNTAARRGGESMLPKVNLGNTCNRHVDGLNFFAEDLVKRCSAGETTACSGCAARTTAHKKYGATWTQIERHFSAYGPLVYPSTDPLPATHCGHVAFLVYRSEG